MGGEDGGLSVSPSQRQPPMESSYQRIQYITALGRWAEHIVYCSSFGKNSTMRNFNDNYTSNFQKTIRKEPEINFPKIGNRGESRMSRAKKAT